MPDEPQDEERIETSTGQLPAATPAPEDVLAEAIETAALTEEELQERQAAMGTRRKPAGPPLGPGPADDSEALDESAAVPETDVTDAPNLDTE